MAYLGYSDEFDLDDDGILRDSSEPDGILIDDDGIVRDDFDVFSKRTSSTHWTDSGLGGDKQSSTPSTLRQLDLQSYPSFEDVSHQLDESNVNISDLEASKDDLSFDEYDNEHGISFGDRPDTSANHPKGGNRSGLSSRSSFDHSLNFEEVFDNANKSDAGSSHQELFGEDYFRQLQELGVLVDEADFGNQKSSLQEFETFEDECSREFDKKQENAIDEFLQRDTQGQPRDSLDIDVPDNVEPRNNKRSFVDERRDFVFPDDFGNLNGEDKPRTRPNTASSTRTISSRSFPEISPEEALELYTEQTHRLVDNDADSIDFEESQKTVEQVDKIDDEIYFENSSQASVEQPKPAKMPAFDNENVPSLTPKSERSPSRGSTHSSHSRSSSSTPRADEDDIGTEDRGDSFTQVTGLDSRARTQSELDSFRPDSPASQISTASDRPVVRPKIRKQPVQKGSQKLPKARSQESFFEVDEKSPSKVAEKGPKRLLPKPTSGEVNQSFKIKSKSTTNIAAQGPVKPTHMSLSEIQHMKFAEGDLDLQDQSEAKSTSSETPKVELSKKLKQESSKRKQATELVKQLQTDYDKLLSKYALAELTIDQLRLGAKISLYANSPTPSQGTSGSLQSAQQPQFLQLGAAQRGMSSASPFQGGAGVFFPDTPGSDLVDNRLPQHGGPSPQLPRSDSTNSMDSTSTPRGEVEQPGGIADGAEKVKLGLLFQARNLDQRMESFQNLLASNQITVEDQEKVFDQIRINHEQLRRDYLQSKEDYNVLKRSTAAGSEVNFDQEKELEGELFKLGMKFDEIHEKVDENMKEQADKRQPFQTKRQSEGTDSGADSTDPDPATENMKRKMAGTKAGDDLIEPKPDSELDKKLKHLHEEYNALMDRYRRLKQMAKSPERDKEIDNLVKKLRKICNEEPDIFRLPPDLQERWDRMRRKERRTDGDLNQSRATDTHSQRSQSPRGAHGRGPSHNDSMDSSRSSVYQNGHAGDRSIDGARGRDDTENRLRDSGHRSGSYSSLSSRGRYSPSPRDASFHDRESPVPSLPRPRRHDHPDSDRRDRRGLKKRPEAGSTSSLPDSGISEHEGAGGAASRALDKLPGPGKFKQMTRRREHDTDSGFIGSMVGSEVSAGNLSSRRPPQQSPMRVHHPGDQRPSSRQSSSGSARPGTPSSTTSSRSARRTPTRGTPPHTPSRTPTRTPTGTPNHLERQEPLRLRPSSRDHAGQSSRDYTDDSYTTVTESELSFDSDLRPRRAKPTSHNTSRQIEKIEEDSEEEQYSVDPTLNETTDLNLSWITSESDGTSTRHSRRSNNSQKGPKKVLSSPTKIVRPTQPGKTRDISVDADRTPTASPTRDTTEDTYTSDETTPRSVIERERKQANHRAAAPSTELEIRRAASPGPVIQISQQIESVNRPGLQYQQLSARDRRSHELRAVPSSPKTPQRATASVGVGSGSDETILASDAETAATRGSVNSQRLKLLSDEIGKLRDEFKRSHQEQQRQLQMQNQAPVPAPLPVTQPQQQNDPYYDQYFDPTEDPLAFMRGPRRRANSFSGRGGRDWDYDWSLPQNHRDHDIPLGYAAADAFAEPRKTTEETTRSRGRQRLQQRIRMRNAGTQHYVDQNGYNSDQSPTRQPPTEEVTGSRLQGHYGYYSPKPVHQMASPEQPTQTPGQNIPLQAGRRVYGSQPNLTFTGYQPPHLPPRSARSVASTTSTSQTTRSARPLRQGLYYTATGNQPRQTTTYAQDDIFVNDGRRTFIPSGASEIHSDIGTVPATHGAVYTSTCPLCGSSSSHTHGEYVYPPPSNQPLGYLVQTPARERPGRSRSKSATRMRHYSPDGRVRSRYFVREFGSGSESAESDVEVDYRPSRPATDRQRRMRRGRKYRRMRGVGTGSLAGLELAPSNTGEVTPAVQPAVEGADNPQSDVNPDLHNADSSPEAEADLNESLHLVDEIDLLTRKMINTVGSELAKTKRKEFGSSVW